MEHTDDLTPERFHEATVDSHVIHNESCPYTYTMAEYMRTLLPFYAGGGVALKDTAGNWRKLVIDGNTGAISTVLIPDDEVPAGIDVYPKRERLRV